MTHYNNVSWKARLGRQGAREEESGGGKEKAGDCLCKYKLTNAPKKTGVNNGLTRFPTRNTWVQLEV